MPSSYPIPHIRYLLPPLLASLPAATVSHHPPEALLSVLSPILRQRLKLLSANEPWIGLLCYDSNNTNRLSKVVLKDKFDLHPISGEVEVDWDGEVRTQYRRVDEETLQALVCLSDLQLCIKLIWVVGDPERGDGWRIGEVGAIDVTDDMTWGHDTIDEAELNFKTHSSSTQSRLTNGTFGLPSIWQCVEASQEEDNDDDYWAQYDQTPARTPGPHHAPPPQTTSHEPMTGISPEDAYYAQYASVQPAMDSYDPDEAAQNGEVETTLGKVGIGKELRHELTSHPEFAGTAHNQNVALASLGLGQSDARGLRDKSEQRDLVQPRPSSSQSSNGSATVAHLERAAAHESMGQSEMAVKQHIGYTVKSLYRLSKAAGIDRSEFGRLVSMELELLSVGEEDD